MLRELGSLCIVSNGDCCHHTGAIADCGDYGIRGMLAIGMPNIDEPAQAKALDALIQWVRAHPAFYSYHLVDEPGAGAFPKLGKLVAFLRQQDLPSQFAGVEGELAGLTHSTVDQEHFALFQPTWAT